MNNWDSPFPSPEPATKDKEERNQSEMTGATFEESVNEFQYALRIEGKAEKTLEQYNYVLDKFGNFINDNPPLESISPLTIRKFLQYLTQKDLAKATVAIHFRVLRAFFNWLVGEGLLSESPVRNIKEPKTPKKYPRILKRDQVNELLAAAKKHKNQWAGQRNYTITICFVDMGLRLSELINSKIKDLSISERRIKVHGKGSKDRMVYFGHETYKALRRWLDIRDKKGKPFDETIFISQTGEKLKKRYVQHIISDLQEEAGLEDIKVSPHVLRHTAATLAVENGIGPFHLQIYFGWESIRTAQKYVHMDGSSVKESFTASSPVDNLNKDRN